MSREKDVRIYYSKTALEAYRHWGAGQHFCYYDDPPDFAGVEPEVVFAAHQKSQERMLTVIADFVKVQKGDVILDAGCGEGSMFPILEERGATVLGLNIVRIHLERARQRTEEQRLVNSMPVEADYNQVPLSNSSVDKVLFVESFTHSSQSATTLTETARILKPTGEVIIVEPVLTMSRSDLAGETKTAVETLDRGMALSVTSLVDLESDAEQAGLSIVEVGDITPHVLPSMQLAAASAEAHQGEDAPNDVIAHRLAAIEYRNLVEKK
jgi:cyclopropane fatty-acyl-phospholipid synthase-like methyltransferase